MDELNDVKIYSNILMRKFYYNLQKFTNNE